MAGFNRRPTTRCFTVFAFPPGWEWCYGCWHSSARRPLRGAIVPVVAAKLWHLGVLIGLTGIFSGNSTGFAWLEFPRASSVILFFAYLLLASWAMMNFAARRERELFPSHWFLVAALFWFPWIYSTANLFLVACPVRGVVQFAINSWFANNLLFVWLALVGIGTAFYFLPKFSGRPLQTHYFALFAFWTLVLFGTWCGIPPGAPLPAWMPALSSVAATLTIVPRARHRHHRVANSAWWGRRLRLKIGSSWAERYRATLSRPGRFISSGSASRRFCSRR